MKAKQAARPLLFLVVVLLAGVIGGVASPAQERVSPAQKGGHSSSFKDILARVPANERTKFLESMTFVKGKLASAWIQDLKRSLSAGDFKELKASVGWRQLSADHEGYSCNGPGECKETAGYMCNPQYCTGGGRAISLVEILDGVPADNRRQFLNSLDFQDGRLVRADAGTILDHVKAGKWFLVAANFGQLEPEAIPLTIGECMRLGGTVTVDTSCPETSLTISTGGALKGKFTCNVGTGNMCVDENMVP